MNSAILVQELLSLEVNAPCEILVLCEDALAEDRAMELCRQLLVRFDSEMAFTLGCWKFKDLENPVPSHWAAEALARADIVLFSIRGTDLPLTAIRWLDSCAGARSKAEGAFALITVEPSGAGMAGEALLYQLQHAASRLRMDFLPRVSRLPDEAVRTPVNLSSLAAFANMDNDEMETAHWGLNE